MTLVRSFGSGIVQCCIFVLLVVVVIVYC